MSIKNKTIVEIHNELVNGNLTVQEIANEVIELSKTEENSNFLVKDNFDEMLKEAKKLDEKGIEKDNLLYGIPYYTKDNFSTHNLQTTAGSRLLEDFKPTYDATVTKMYKDKDTLLAGKVNMDEFGMGGTGLSSGYGKLSNPKDSKRLAGGSSSGSVYAVAKGIIPFATGSDTGDSIRKPASYNGLVGYKPTYGAISRYGMMPYAPSLDHPGVIARTVEDASIAAEAIIGRDFKDFTSIDIDEKEFYKNLNNFDKNKSFGYIKAVHDNLPKELKEKYETLFEILKEEGIAVKPIHFRNDLLEALAPSYMMISFSEAVSTLADLDGINFGQRVDAESWEEIMKRTRTQKIGSVPKRRFIIGSLNLKKENQHIYLLKAKKVRRLIAEEVMKAFNLVDLLILPASTDIAPYIEKATEYDQNDSKYEFIEDILTLGNFAGIPSITIPFVEKLGLGIGLNINAAPKKDLLTFQAAKKLEEFINKMDKEIK